MTLPFPVNTTSVMSMDITVNTPLFNRTSCMKSMDIIVNTVEQPKQNSYFFILRDRASFWVPKLLLLLPVKLPVTRVSIYILAGPSGNTH